MKLNGKNIVFDDDITMTGQENTGKKLSEVIGELQSDSSKMKSYLKWIYNYGGVGGSGGSGGGGGGNSGSDYILYATLNEIQLKEGQNISLGGPGNYPLKIQIQRPGGANFTAKYKIKAEGSSKIIYESETIILNLSNSYTYEKAIELTTNAVLIVEVTDSLYNITKQASTNFVTQSYLLTSTFTDNKGSELLPELTVDDAKKGLIVTFNYEIAIPYKSLNYSLVINLQDRSIIVDSLTNQEYYEPIKEGSPSGSLKLDLLKILKGTANWEPSPENAGFYSYVLTANIAIEGQFTKPIEFSGNFNLIPRDLYLLVSPTIGNIYTTPNITQEDNPYKYGVGYISFIIKPYKGAELDSQCKIYYYLVNDGDEDEGASREITIQSNLRSPEYIEVYATKEGLNNIRFKLECGGDFYPSKTTYANYYFWVELDKDGVNWYNLTESPRKGVFNYYRGGYDDGSNSLGEGEWNNQNLRKFRNFVKGQTYKQSVNKKPIPIDLTGTEGNWKLLDEKDSARELKMPGDNPKYTTVLHLGLQYSEINTSDAIILTGYTGKPDNTIEWLKVYQDKIVIENTNIIKYYFPKTKDNFGQKYEYHLLSLVFRYMYTVGYDRYYEITVYVDGVLEGALQSYLQTEPRITGLLFGKTNMWIDLLDLSYLNYLQKGTESEESVPEDLSVYQYYMRYHLERRKDTEEEVIKYNKFKNILGYSKNMTINNNGEVTCDTTTVSNIAKNLAIPTLIMDIQDNDGSIKKYLDSYYEENEGTAEYNTKLHWAVAGGEMKDVVIPTNTICPNGAFKIKIQGSSTKQYKCKNYTLSLVNEAMDEESPVYLFSPNFVLDDPKTFLPEQQFTLKADVVDSSHSNNTSIGRFVNDITRKFITNRLDESTGNEMLQSHVKNCLDGFPIVVYINYIKSTESGDISNCYYQGVYNFNLGRESHFNLGYSNYMIFCDENTGAPKLESVKDNFLFFSAPKTAEAMKEGLLVAEIQGNSAFFDFSQYDPSILFYQDIVGDKLYMFGDLVLGSLMTDSQAKTILSNVVKKVSKAGGYIFGKNLLKKSFSDSDKDNYGYDKGYHTTFWKKTEEIDPKTGQNKFIELPANQVPNYRKQFKKIITPTGEVVPTPNDGWEPEAEASDVDDLIITNQEETGIKAKPWIDFRSLSEYYTICMAFGLVDSVQKNMNIKTWNASTSDGKATFYIAFYDMDTCLGVNNEGKDVSYFAFSDYWDYTEESSTSGSTIKPSPITIYRDYSPEAGSEKNDAGDFYDTASSYLFAVAKYARKLYNGADDVLLEGKQEVEKWPKELWKNWRSNVKSDVDKTKGCLSSAEDFMNKYFANNLGSVCPILISMNYRNKYLVKFESEPYIFNGINFEKFNGTRIYKATDWLSSRFHILDAYFNVTNSISNYQFYDEHGEYTSETNLQEPSVVDSGSLALNPDVLIYQDIFAGNAVNQGAGTLDVTVKAHEYSPLFITTPTSNQRFLLGGDKKYNIVTKLSGTQIYKFGGSGAWTDLDSINSFNFNTLTINSKYLETLSSDNNNKMDVREENINLPSLKNLILTGPNFFGHFKNTLTADDGTERDKYTNLDHVDVSNSSISLELKKSSCHSVNISKMRHASVYIVDCKELDNLILGYGSNGNPSTTLDLLDIRPIPYKLVRDGVRFNYSRIKKLNLVNDKTTVSSSKPNGTSVFELKNDDNVEFVTVSGFSEIIIEECHKLRELIITEADKDQGDPLHSIKLINCGISVPNLKIGKRSTPDREADLSYFPKLSEITIKGCTTFNRLKLPEDGHTINLEKECLSGNRSLRYISGEGLVVNGPGVFYNCAFSLQKGPESEFKDRLEERQLKLTLNTTDISNLFNIGSVNREAAQFFLDPSHTVGLTQVTKIDGLFANNPIKYDEEMLISDYKLGTKNYIDLTPLRKVTSANSLFAWCGITAWHPKMLGFGQDVSSVEANGFASIDPRPSLSSPNEKDREWKYISVMRDSFNYIINKWTGTFGWSHDDDSDWYCLLKVIDNNGNILGKSSTFNVKDLFHPSGKNPSRLTNISFVGFHPEMTNLNFSGLFNGWSELRTINRFLFDREYPNMSGLDSLLTPCNRLYSVRDSLRINNRYNPIDLNTFCNWNNILTNSANAGVEPFGNSMSSSYRIELGSFHIYKFMKEDDFAQLLLKFKEKNVKGISNIFRNCTVVYSSSNVINFGKSANTSIKNMVGTFCNFKMKPTNLGNPSISQVKSIAVNGQESYFSIDHSIFKDALRGVTVMPYAFCNTKITTPNEKNSTVFPLDFFGRRKEGNTISSYYIKPEDLKNLKKDTQGNYTYMIDGNIVDQDIVDAFKPATVHPYIYTHDISDMRCMFKNVRWERETDTEFRKNARSFIFEKDDLDKFNYLPADYIRVESTGEKIDTVGTDYYKVRTKVVSLKLPEGGFKDAIAKFFIKSGELKINKETQDIKEVVEIDKNGVEEPLGSYNPIVSSVDRLHNFKNFPLDTENVTKRLFIAPDFLYGCRSNCNITGLFGNDFRNNSIESQETLEGMIPDHFLEYCKSTSIKNMFKNLNIIPKYRQTETIGTDSTIDKYKIYSFIPPEFTNVGDLSDSFNFHFIIPRTPFVKGNTTWHEAYYVLLGNSIGPTTNSLSNSLPSVGYDFNNESLIESNSEGKYPDSHKVSYQIYYNVMHTITTTTSKEGVIEYKGVDGIDMHRFRELALDNLIPSIMSFFLTGNLFNDSFMLNDIRWDNPKNNVIRAYSMGYIEQDERPNYPSYDSIISKDCLLPKAEPDTGLLLKPRRIITFGLKLRLYGSQIKGTEDNETPYNYLYSDSSNTHSISVIN